MKECLHCGAVVGDAQIACPHCEKGNFVPQKGHFVAQKDMKSVVPLLTVKPRLFLSHAWDHGHKYREMVRLLNDVYDWEWENLSIPEDEAIQVAAEPQVCLEQQREQIAERLSELDRLLELQRRKERDLTEKWNVARRQDREVHKNAISEELDQFERASEKLAREGLLLKTERAALIRHLEDNKPVLDIFNRNPNRKPAQDTTRQRALREYPNLALAINRRVSKANCVLVIATTGSSWKYWIEFEIDLAVYASKPLFGVACDPSRVGLPPEFKNFGIIEVPWDGKRLRHDIDTRLAVP